jgi:hypothetical protein
VFLSLTVELHIFKANIENRVCNIDSSTIIYAENSGISLPFDSWKIIIQYLNSKDRGYWFGFGSILSYRAINKMFSNMISECIREVKIVLNHSMNLRELRGFNKGSNNYFLKKRQNIFNVICGCKELRSLHISVTFSTSFRYSDHTVDHNKLFEGLQQIGNDCKHIEELCFTAKSREITTKKLPLFPKLRKLYFGPNFHVLPPDNMQNVINLRVIEGNLLVHPWTHAISKLS